MSARLPKYILEEFIAGDVESAAHDALLLVALEFERDPPLTEQERWHEELGRTSLRRKQVCSSVGALELSGTRFERPRLDRCADDSARRLLLGCSIKNGPGD